MQVSLRSHLLRLALAGTLFGASLPARAAIFDFNVDPFAGTTALSTPGRQVIGNEISIPVFDFANDVLRFDTRVFDIAPGINFVNSRAAGLPTGRVNVIALRDIDADNNPANGVLNNAGLSANLIAGQITESGAGFFVYFNSVLNLNRLVYSTDLNSPTADLKILARFTGQTGLAAAAALPAFTAGNFATAVPEPASWALLITGFGMVGAAMRRRTSHTVTA